MSSDRVTTGSMDTAPNVPVPAVDFVEAEKSLFPAALIENFEEEPSENPVHVISMIPGIRDVGVFVDRLEFYSRENALRIKAEPVKPSRVNSMLFLSRIGASRRELEVLADLLRIRLLYPDATHSILAHSYGTEMLGRIIHRIPTPYATIFLCGAVARQPAAEHFLNKTQKLVNDCSLRDNWPLVAETLNPCFYEATGTHGMRSPRVQNRFHDCSHSGYLSPEHFERYIVPVLLRKREIPSQPPCSTWKSHLPPYVRRGLGLLIVLLVLFLYLLWR